MKGWGILSITHYNNGELPASEFQNHIFKSTVVIFQMQLQSIRPKYVHLLKNIFI